MKKSDLLAIIVNKIPKYMTELQKERLAKNILFEIENAGMLPPLNEQVYHHMDNDDRRIVNESAKYFTWEDEDE